MFFLVLCVNVQVLAHQAWKRDIFQGNSESLITNSSSKKRNVLWSALPQGFGRRHDFQLTPQSKISRIK
jgi:hypothetical protein